MTPCYGHRTGLKRTGRPHKNVPEHVVIRPRVLFTLYFRKIIRLRTPLNQNRPLWLRKRRTEREINFRELSAAVTPGLCDLSTKSIFFNGGFLSFSHCKYCKHHCKHHKLFYITVMIIIDEITIAFIMVFISSIMITNVIIIIIIDDIFIIIFIIIIILVTITVIIIISTPAITIDLL